MRLSDYTTPTERPLYNAVLEARLLPTSLEPVTLVEVKAHLKIDFSDEDNYLTALITSCRSALERYTGVSISGHTIVAVLKNECGNIELPYGPVVFPINDIEFLDIDGEVIDSADMILTGDTFLRLSTITDYVKVTYVTGYNSSTLPQDLKYAVLEEIAFRYHNRGSVEGVSAGARGFADNHKRTWLL